MGAAYVRLFSPEGTVKAYNLFAVRRLAGDVAELQVAVAGCAVPDVETELAEASQLCAMLLADRVRSVESERGVQRIPGNGAVPCAVSCAMLLAGRVSAGDDGGRSVVCFM
jgi:hypothetical protein